LRFGALRKTRALRPPRIVLPKKLDLRRPLPQSLRVTSANLRFVDRLPAVCARDVRSFENAVSRAYTSPLGGEATGAALTSNAAQVAGLGRIYFEFLWPGPQGFRQDQLEVHRRYRGGPGPAESNFLIIRFLFSILEGSNLVASVLVPERPCERKPSIRPAFSEGTARPPQGVCG
jgi:hypothetical protein